MVKKRWPNIGGVVGYTAAGLMPIVLWALPTAGAPLLAIRDGTPAFEVESSLGTGLYQKVFVVPVSPWADGWLFTAMPLNLMSIPIVETTPFALLKAQGFRPTQSGTFDTAPFLSDTNKSITSPVTIKSDADTARAIPPTILTSSRPDTSFWRRPTGVLFKSVIFPGWGQYANGKYQKAAVFFVLESFFIVKSVEYFKKTRDRFDKFKETENGRDFFPYDEAKKTRNKYYWYVAGTIFISMWDAYADAHIKPFEETKDKADDFWGLEDDDKPDLSPPQLSLALTIRF